MNQICSSLLTNSKKLPGFHQVYKPRYNKEFFKRLLKNSENLKELITKRCKNSNLDLHELDFEALKRESGRLIKLKDQLEKVDNKSEDESANKEIWDRLEQVEERVLPTISRLPNRASKEVPIEDKIIEIVDSDSIYKGKLAKTLSCTKLSYINNCYSKSVVGPNSHYYFGIGAKLQHGLTDYFTTNLESKRNFIPISGLNLIKSAVVEAVNTSNTKSFTNDAARILNGSSSSAILHLVEASRESLIGFVTTLSPRLTDTPLRLFTSGAGYRQGTDWFDPDQRKVAQFETIHAVSLNSSIEAYSMKEYRETKDLLWSLYRKLKLPTRLVHCSYESMYDNEYDAFRIDVWLPSKQSWIEASRISHYLDYLTIRTGMKRGHFIDSKVFDGQALVSAIIENNQTPTGKFIIPSILKEHMIYLNPEERAVYVVDQEIDSKSSTHCVMRNYDQRRYLVKKTALFGHSKRAEKNEYVGPTTYFLTLAVVICIVFMLDWEELYYDYFSPALKRFLYDSCFRPLRRAWWWVTYPEGKEMPEDIPFERSDNAKLNKYQRAKNTFYAARQDGQERKDR